VPQQQQQMQATSPTFITSHGASTHATAVAAIVVLTCYALGLLAVLLAVLRRRQAVRHAQSKNNISAAELTDKAVSCAATATTTAVPHSTMMGLHYRLDPSHAARHHLSKFRALSNLLQGSEDDDESDSCCSATATDGYADVKDAADNHAHEYSGGSDGERRKRAQLHSSRRLTHPRRRRCGSAATTAAAVACSLRLEPRKLSPPRHHRHDSQTSGAWSRSLAVVQHPRSCRDHSAASLTLLSFSVRRESTTSGCTGVLDDGEVEDDACFCSPLEDVYGPALLQRCSSNRLSHRISPTDSAAATAAPTSRSSSSSHTSTGWQRRNWSCPTVDNVKPKRRRAALMMYTSAAYEADSEAEQVEEELVGRAAADSARRAYASDTAPPSPPVDIVLVDDAIDMCNPCTFLSAREGDDEVTTTTATTTALVHTAKRHGSGLLSASNYRCRRPGHSGVLYDGNNEEAEEEGVCSFAKEVVACDAELLLRSTSGCVSEAAFSPSPPPACRSDTNCSTVGSPLRASPPVISTTSAAPHEATTTTAATMATTTITCGCVSPTSPSAPLTNIITITTNTADVKSAAANSVVPDAETRLIATPPTACLTPARIAHRATQQQQQRNREDKSTESAAMGDGNTRFRIASAAALTYANTHPCEGSSESSADSDASVEEEDEENEESTSAPTSNWPRCGGEGRKRPYPLTVRRSKRGAAAAALQLLSPSDEAVCDGCETCASPSVSMPEDLEILYSS
jgi:hypothetical protein